MKKGRLIELVTSCLGSVFENITEGKIERGIEVTGRQGRRLQQLLNDLNEIIGYCKLKEED